MRTISYLFLFIIFSNDLLAGENDLYDFLWLDPDKSVYVLQNKLYPKSKSYFAQVHYLQNLTSTFQDTEGSAISVGYYFSEEWAIELSHSSYNHKNNNTYENVKLVNGIEPFMRRFNSETSIYAKWSPFYGKINTFNRIYYFDWSFGAGIGISNAESNIESVRNAVSKNIFKAETYNPIKINTELKFHIQKGLHLSLELDSGIYQAPGPKDINQKKWEQNSNLLIGIGVSF